MHLLSIRLEEERSEGMYARGGKKIILEKIFHEKNTFILYKVLKLWVNSIEVIYNAER